MVELNHLFKSFSTFNMFSGANFNCSGCAYWEVGQVWFPFSYWHTLVPRPRPAFHRLHYGKAGRAWYLFSHEHDVINKWQKKIFNEKSKVSCIVQPTTSSMLGMYNSRPLLATYVWCVTWYLSSSCCSEPQCTHVQLSPFYHLSTLDVTHVRKDIRPSAFFVQPKTVRAWERG